MDERVSRPGAPVDGDDATDYGNVLRAVNRPPDDRVLRNYARNYDRFLPRGRDATILDFGCGMGHFLGYLQRSGYTDLLGADTSPDLVSYVGSTIGCRVELMADPLEWLARHPAQFDLVVMKEVVEHLDRDAIVAYLRLIRASLRPGGTVIVETENGIIPSGLYVFAKDFTHRTLFTEESLEQALRMAGFSDVRLHGRVLGTGALGLLWRALRSLALLPTRLLLTIDRAGATPSIWDRHLIAVASG